MIKKVVINILNLFIIFTYDSCMFASSASQSDNAISPLLSLDKKDENTYIVIPRYSEDIVSHKKMVYTMQTGPQALVMCPTNPAALNNLRKKLEPKARTKLEEQILLSSIMQPVFDYMKNTLQQKSPLRPYAFQVKNNIATPCPMPKDDPNPAIRIFLLENDPISKEWFGDNQKTDNKAECSEKNDTH